MRHRHKRNGSARSAAIQTNGWSGTVAVRANCSAGARVRRAARADVVCMSAANAKCRPIIRYADPRGAGPNRNRGSPNAKAKPHSPRLFHGLFALILYCLSCALRFFVSENVATAHVDRSRRYAQPQSPRQGPRSTSDLARSRCTQTCSPGAEPLYTLMAYFDCLWPYYDCL